MSKGITYHHYMADQYLAGRDRSEDFEVLLQQKRAAFSPQQWLALANLEAVITILRHGRKRRDPQEYEEARRWVQSSADYPFSFSWTCHHFSYDEDAWREKLLAIEPGTPRRHAARPSGTNMGPRPTVGLKVMRTSERKRVAFNKTRDAA